VGYTPVSPRDTRICPSPRFTDSEEYEVPWKRDPEFSQASSSPSKVPQFVVPSQLENAILSNLVLTKIFQYLPFKEVARNATVCKHWGRMSKHATSVSTASVKTDDQYHGALRWLANRNGLRSLDLDVDTRKSEREKVVGDVEAIISILNRHARTLQKMSFYVPVDRFILAHSQSELMKLYASLQGADPTESESVILPRIHTFHFRQKWDSWKFRLPNLRHVSVSMTRMFQCLEFDMRKIESIDIGPSDASSCVQALSRCPNLQTVALNVNEFRSIDMAEVWNTLNNLSHLRRIIFLHFDDFEIKSNEIFAGAALSDSSIEIFYGLLDPTFRYEFDTSQITLSNPIHIFGDNFATNPPKNVRLYEDRNLKQFRSVIESSGVYCPNVARDISDVDDQIIEMSDYVTLQLDIQE